MGKVALPSDDIPPLPRNGTWRTFTPIDGLGALRVEHIVQDGEGYLWFGTATSGVSRFDGSGWRTYTVADGLAGNGVLAGLVGADGRLWLGTLDGGLCWWDGTAFHCPDDAIARRSVSHLFEDSKRRLWFGGPDNLGYWDGKDFVDLVPLYQQSFARDFATCWGIAEDGQGRIWFGSGGGLGEDSQGRIWLGLGGGLGVLMYDGVGICEVLGRESADGDGAGAVVVAGDGRGGLWAYLDGRIWHGDGSEFTPVRETDPGKEVRKIQLDSEGRPWFCGHGVLYADAEGFHSFTERDGLSPGGCEAIVAMLQDREGRIWIATWGGGVSCYDPYTIQVCMPPLPHALRMEPRTLWSAPDGTLWLRGIGRGPDNQAEVRIGRWNGREFSFVEGMADLPAAVCSGTGSGGNGCLCLVYEDRLLRWEDRRLEQIWTFGEMEITSVCCARERGFFFARHLREYRQIEIYYCDGRRCQQLFETRVPFEHTVVTRLLLDAEGVLWAGIGDRYGSGPHSGPHCGLVRLGEETRWYTTDDGLVDGQVRDLLADPQGRLWIATYGGLSCFDGERFHNFTTRDGLLSNSVLGLSQDGQGRLWIATEAGLAVYDGRVIQAVRNPHIGPVRGVCVDGEGRVWCVTSANRVMRYRPGVRPPQVEVTQVGGHRVRTRDAGVEVTVSVPRLAFHYRGRNNSAAGEELRYRCRLQGHETDWRPATAETQVVYESLPVGEYTFEVQAVDVDLNYSKTARVQLTVVPDPHIAALQEALSEEARGQRFVGESAALRRLQQEIAEVATADLPVLILGETGTGKGMAVRLLHRLSEQRDGPFLQVSCGAIPADLVESELFGHEQGAFTGAHARKLGKVELAAGGTLFLDEIGDLPLEGQVKLLRVLEEGVFERVGGTETLKARVRVVAATNRDLRKMMAAERFRADLFFRLQGFVLTMPPLRERMEDIPLLVPYFAEGMAAHLNRTRPEVSAGALDVLQAHSWPGNVRELEHVVRRAVVVCRGGVIRPEDLGIDSGMAQIVGEGERVSLEEMERRYIRQVLEWTDWVIDGPDGAAAVLDLKPPTLRYRLKKLGIQRP